MFEAVRTTDAGGGRRLGRSTKTEGHQEDSLERRVNGVAFRRVWGRRLTGSVARRASRAGVRSVRRTSCWARPGSCAGSWWPWDRGWDLEGVLHRPRAADPGEDPRAV